MHVADVERRFDQPQPMRRQIDPAHVAGARRRRRTARRGCQRGGALGAGGRDRGRCRSPLAALPRRRAAVSASDASACMNAGCPARSLQRNLSMRAHLAQRPGRGQAQLARGMLDGAGQRRPVGQAARLRQAHGRAGRARSRSACALPSVRPRNCTPVSDQLVRLVEHRRLDARQQFGHAAVAHREVGEEQVVVDDDQVGRHRFAPRLDDVAGGELRAVAAQAVLARRGHERDHRRAVVEAVDLGQVAAARRRRPGFDARQRAHREAVGQQLPEAPCRACCSRCRHR